MKSKLVSNGIYISVDDEMVFPNPISDRIIDIEWKMRHSVGSLLDADLLVAASVLSAYRELVSAKTQKNRNAICEAMKAAYIET